MSVTTITTAGSGTFIADSTGTLVIEGWGGGGTGDVGPATGHGAGGGSYAKVTVSCTVNDAFAYVVGAASTDTTCNNPSAAQILKAVKGADGSAGGAGGAAASCVGDVKTSGGNGAAHSGLGNHTGGGGGSSASAAGVGGNADAVGDGGVAPAGGGNGGDGGGQLSGGLPGTAPGGAGGGAGSSSSSPGAGAPGQLIFTVTPAAVTPVANFSGTPLVGVAPLTVVFTDSSTNTPTSWSWTFGDGATSTSQNPTHVYATPGVYTVALTATNAGGSNTVTKTLYVTVVPAGDLRAHVRLRLKRQRHYGV